MWETWVWSLGREDPLEKEKATHSSTLAWQIPWIEKPGRLQSIGSERVRHDWATSLSLLPWRVADQCSIWERGACDQAQMITKRHLGLTFWYSLPGELAQCVVSQDTAASSPGSSGEEDTVQGWMVCGPLSSAPFPSPSPPPVPWPLSYHGDLASWEQVFMQSSNFSKLFSLPLQPLYINCSQSLVGHCRHTWSSWHCSHLLI